MKIKIILGVFAAVLFLSVILAPKVVAQGIPFVINSILAAIENLQQQINNIELIPGPQGEQGPQGEPGPAGSNAEVLHLVDGNGQDLGIVIENLKTFLPQENATVQFQVDHNNLGDVTNIVPSGTIKFSVANCTGVAYTESLSTLPGTVLNAGAGFQPGIFYRVTEDSTVNVSFNSLLSGANCQPFIGSSNARRVEQITLPFTDPVAWPLGIVNQ